MTTETKPMTMPLSAALSLVADKLREIGEPEFADVVRQAVRPVEVYPELLAALERIVSDSPENLSDGEYRQAADAVAKAKGEA